LAQPAEVVVRVKRGRRILRVLRHACVDRGLKVRWRGRLRRGRRYRLQLVVKSDRRRIQLARVVRR
jgi:hypothetical protein